MLNNIPTPYNGVLYPSKTEARYAEYLDRLKSEGKVLSWERQITFEVKDDSEKKYKMIVDFLVTFPNRQEIHETKAKYYSDDFKFKLYLWLRRYPNFTYYVVEQDRHGVWTYTTPQQFLKIVDDPTEQTTVELPTKPKKHSRTEVIASTLFRYAVDLFVK